MLAKQGWRLIQHPDSLAAKVMKAKYFPNTTFMNAPKGRRPSYVWRSITAGRDVLSLGMRYRVSNGSNIRIWDDPWLPRPYTFKPCAIRRYMHPQGSVQSLIVPNTGDWNLEKLGDLFLPHDIEVIRTIQLSTLDDADRMIWHHTSNGQYSVRSGYHVYMERQRQQSIEGGCASDKDAKVFWKKLWTITSLPKVKIFLWKVLRGSLSTGYNLHKRMPTMDPMCGACGMDIEDELHCLVECPFARDVWTQAMPMIIQRRCRNFEAILQWLFDNKDEQEISLFSLLCWHIWKSRCCRIFEGKPTPTAGIITAAVGLHEEIVGLSQPSRNKIKGVWEKPKPGAMSINVDAGFREDGTRAYGCLARNNVGELIYACSGILPSGIDIVQGEMLAIKKGFEAARNQQYEYIELWSDCMVAVNLITKEEEPLHPLRNTVLEVRNLMACFISCKLSFTRREHNYPAHMLACLGLENPTFIVWGNSPPLHVLNAAFADLVE